ncbi:MAG: hypothetical protein Q9O74_11010 [Planctomycetota bacterium]|nr:hypothetical protein [Planctomycetota bacterium]
MQQAQIITNPSSILLLAGALSACMTGSAAAQTILAGDMDNFGGTNDPGDTLVIRQPLADWLSRSGSGGNNDYYHNGDPMPFDADLFNEGPPDGPANWEFGYTFENLPTLHPGAKVRIHLKSLGDSYNDSIHLQYTGNGSSFSSLWGSSIDTLYGGAWYGGATAVFDIPLDNLPGGGNIIGNINAVGYLDVYVQDDTAVDWIELTIPAPGTASLLGLGAVVAMRRRR